MKERRLVRVTSTLRDPESGETESLEVVVLGTYDPEQQLLEYEESLDEAEDTVKNRVQMHPQGIHVYREGMVQTDMQYHPGTQTRAEYKTPFGSMDMRVTTYKAEMEDVQGRLRLHLDYEAEINGMHTLAYIVDITAESVEE